MTPELRESIQKATHRYSWHGRLLVKNPFDFSLYPLVLSTLKPCTVIEIGSYQGGSAIWIADLLRMLEIDGHVHSVDLRPPQVDHPDVTFHRGDAREAPLPEDLLHRLPHPWLVIDDSDHQYQTVLYLLRYFHPWLTRGDYLIIEDGIVSDLPEAAAFEGGPVRAIHEFLAERPGQYEIDRALCDFWGPSLTWNTDGYLERVA